MTFPYQVVPERRLDIARPSDNYVAQVLLSKLFFKENLTILFCVYQCFNNLQPSLNNDQVPNKNFNSEHQFFHSRMLEEGVRVDGSAKVCLVYVFVHVYVFHFKSYAFFSFGTVFPLKIPTVNVEL